MREHKPTGPLNFQSLKDSVGGRMRSMLAVTAFALLVPTRLQALEVDVHYSTTTPSNAQYEIVQSSITMRDTYRLDRFTGHVCRMVKTKDDDRAWQEIPVCGGLPSVGAVPRFQLFLSGIAARGTYLMDTRTGRTWQLVEVAPKSPGESSDEVFAPLAE